VPANIPQPIEDEDEEMQIAVEGRTRVKKRRGKVALSYKDKIFKKKDHQRRKSVNVRKDTKYTARTRKSRAF